MQDQEDPEKRCPIFPVERGGPVIGLGIILLLFVGIPYIGLGIPPLPLPAAVSIAGFGLCCIWAGLTR
jgi:hypothetical protein